MLVAEFNSRICGWWFGGVAFPGWHFDVLRGLEYLRRADVAPDERVADTIELVASKRDADGTWPLETHEERDR